MSRCVVWVFEGYTDLRSALTAELIAHQLRLAELLRQTATLGAVEALAHNAISSVVTASTKVGNLVKVWSIVCADQCLLRRPKLS